MDKPPCSACDGQRGAASPAYAGRAPRPLGPPRPSTEQFAPLVSWGWPISCWWVGVPKPVRWWRALRRKERTVYAGCGCLLRLLQLRAVLARWRPRMTPEFAPTNDPAYSGRAVREILKLKPGAIEKLAATMASRVRREPENDRPGQGPGQQG
jgi:hypothetical protein